MSNPQTTHSEKCFTNPEKCPDMKPQTTLKDELERVTVKAFLPKAKEQAIAVGDMEWLKILHEIERKYAEQN